MRAVHSHKNNSIPPWMAIALAAAAALAGGYSLLVPSPARASEAADYPWCVSRESYLSCFYATQEQCEQAASGIGGCAQNPRLLFLPRPRERVIRSRG